MPTGIAIAVDDTNKVIGTITTGDIRRALLKEKTLTHSVDEFIERNPILFNINDSIPEILEKLPVELSNRGRRSKKYLGKIVLVDDDGHLVRVMDYHELWEQRIATHRHIVVLGLGYVGLTLAMVLAEEGFLVTGIDPDERKIEQLKAGKSYIFEKGLNELVEEQVNKNFLPSTEIPDDGDVYIISVGTPVKSNGSENPKPEMHFIKQVSEQIGRKLKQGNLVILRSTVPIGTSRNVVLPILEKTSGLKCGREFHLSFAPERTAEGKALQELRSLPQIVGGFNEDSTQATAAMFRELTSTIVRVSSLESAETIKLVNNTFRDLIFSYSNYISQISANFNIDINEVIQAANQGYPRDPVPLPSPGVGGPCLTKDPYIFAAVAESIGHQGQTIFEVGRKINESMQPFLVNRIVDQLNELGKVLASTKIMVCGLAFKGKPETGDIRSSTSIDIYHRLIEQTKSKSVYGHDPVAEQDEMIELGVKPIEFEKGINDADVILFLNNNPFYEKLNIYNTIRALGNQPIILDSWKLFRASDILNIKPCIYMNLSATKKSI